MQNLIYILLGILLSSPLFAYTKGQISFESKIYKDDGIAKTEDAPLSLSGQIETADSIKGVDYNVGFFARYYRDDQGTSYIYPEDLNLQYTYNDFALTVGQKVFNWSATEVFHPTDVINAPNFDSNFEKYEKKGESIISLSYEGTNYIGMIFYSPYVMAANYPAGVDRKSLFDPSIELKSPKYLTSDGTLTDNPFHTQFGMSLDFTLERIGMDLKVFYLDHYDRYKARYIVESLQSYSPVYFPVKRVGLKGEMAIDSIMIKIENSYNDFYNSNLPQAISSIPDHNLLAIGIDYGINLDNGLDITWYMEHQKVYGLTKAKRANLEFFQNDFLVGQKINFNDQDSSEINAYMIVDIERSHEYLLSLSGKTRVLDSLTLEMAARYVDAPIKKDQPVNMEIYHHDHQLLLNVTKHF